MQTTVIMAVLAALLLSLPVTASELPPPRPEQLKLLHSSVNALSSALDRIGKEKQREHYTTPILNKSEELQQSAQTLIQQGKLTQAQQQLGLAMDIVKTAIANLRNQETLIRSLNFASPKDEYAYEQERYKGYCALVDLLIQGHANKASIILRHQAKIIAEIALYQASEQQYAKALETQEQSNKIMLKAIRSSGVYIPG